jgi:replicative DNA helicase
MTATVDADLVLPHDLDAEKATLGAVLVAPERFHDVSAVISEDHFFRRAHRDIFAAMRSVLHSGRSLDFITLKNETPSIRSP